MIEIRLDDRSFTLEIKGHAMAEEGPEHRFICSNVSVIAQGLAYCLTKYEKEHEALYGMDYRPEEGDLLLKALPEDWAKAAVKKRFQIAGDMLEMLAICEGSYIHMTWNGQEIIGQGGDKEDE